MQDLKGAMEVVISLREEVRNPASGNPLEKLESQEQCPVDPGLF